MVDKAGVETVPWAAPASHAPGFGFRAGQLIATGTDSFENHSRGAASREQEKSCSKNAGTPP